MGEVAHVLLPYEQREELRMRVNSVIDIELPYFSVGPAFPAQRIQELLNAFCDFCDVSCTTCGGKDRYIWTLTLRPK